ncbi:MAG TPA: hypothetical protein VHY30_01500 [Verrucomicrobiae bacterium]|jgi:hypothetical protein|nr:hypothetical protein [Verrucomicrobiae bacterium]
MKNPNKPNADILTVLEAHGLNWQTFAALRSDSYEQQLAKSSPEDLDKFYSLLFSPGTSLEEKVLKCPDWPSGTRNDGSKPTQRILSEVATRWNSERTLDVVSEVGAMMEKWRAKISKTPNAETSGVTDSLFAMMSQELLASKLEGENLSSMTKALDRLLRKQKLDSDFTRLADAKKTDQQKALEYCLEESKGTAAEDLFKQAFAALKKAKSK